MPGKVPVNQRPPNSRPLPEKARKKYYIYRGEFISSVRRRIEEMIDGLKMAICDVEVRADEDLSPAERAQVWRLCVDLASRIEKTLLLALEQLRSEGA